jgi:hypothetical protein
MVSTVAANANGSIGLALLSSLAGRCSHAGSLRNPSTFIGGLASGRLK